MDSELNKLAQVRAPQPSAQARDRAISAALGAFDQAQKKSQATQGSAFAPRQSSIATLLWSFVMTKKLLAGSALATLLIVPAAGYLTFNYLQNRPTITGIVADNNVPVKKKELPVGGEIKSDNEPSQPIKVDEVAEIGRLATETKSQQSDDADAAGTVELPAEPEASTEGDILVGQADAAKPMTAMPNSTLAQKTLALPSAEALPLDAMPPLLSDDSGDRFAGKDANPVKSVATEPVSTFSIDVDTASYAYARQAIMNGHLPEADSVRVEEMINYFPYDWKGPDKAEEAFRANVTVLPTPWNKDTKLMHIGIKGFDLPVSAQKPANLVFLIDVSGSMDEADKLPLLKSAFRLLVNRLKPSDTVSIVTYAGNSGVVLEPTKASERDKILAAIDNLTPGGSTAGAAGIEAAYALAQKAFVKEGVNRVLLATDGDFNVGPSSDEDLKSMIEVKRKSGIFLSVLGFGNGNYNDGLMQVLAQNGNGVAAYIDTLSEAQKTLVQEATASLFPIAKDVKIQVEFNPAKIAEYRLIGYETRALNREDFNNDKIDAGEIGSGHRVTAIYEITPKGSPAVLNDDLRYGDKAKDAATAPAAASDELAFVKIRYKQPDADKSNLITMPVGEAQALPLVDRAAEDVRFSVAVAAFGQKLKGENAVTDYGYDAILGLAEGAKGEDRYGYRAEFLKMIELAKSLKAD